LGAAHEENQVLRAQTLGVDRPLSAPSTMAGKRSEHVSLWNAVGAAAAAADANDGTNVEGYESHRGGGGLFYEDCETSGGSQYTSVHVNRVGQVTISPRAEARAGGNASGHNVGRQQQQHQQQQERQSRRQSLRNDGDSVASSRTSGSRFHYYYDLDGRRRQHES
jgi:hypothetical protein